MLTVYWEECFLLGHLEGFGFTVCSARHFACAVLSSRCFLLPTYLAATTKEHFEKHSKHVLFFSKQAGALLVCSSPLPPFFFPSSLLFSSLLHFSGVNFDLLDSRGKNQTWFSAIHLKVGISADKPVCKLE